MYQKHKNDAAFVFVYIQEAHPEDGWPVDDNSESQILHKRAKSWNDRSAVAATCCEQLKLTMPVVVDDLDNPVDDLYAAWPERMFVVDHEGLIAYAARRGPWGFKPREVERALRRVLAARSKDSR
jgi:hypothetical protein